MKLANLDLSQVELNLEEKTLDKIVGLSTEEGSQFAEKMAHLITKASKGEVNNAPEAAKEILDKLTEKEAAMLLIMGVHSGVEKVLELSKDPMIKLKMLLQKLNADEG